MHKASICGVVLFLALIFANVRANIASLNTATLLFGSVFPSSSAAPGSCISITSEAELLFDAGNMREEPLRSQWNASTLACPPPPSAANSSQVPYSLIFEGLHAGNSSSSRQLAIKIHAIQKAASSVKNKELRWSRTISLDFSAGSAAENLDLDLQAAKLYSTTKPAKQPPIKSSEDHQLVATALSTLENTKCAPLANEEQEHLLSKRPSAAQQGLVALLCLAAGILTGRVFSAKLSSKPPSSNHRKQTREVACSPFIVEKVVKATGSRAKHKWYRDDDGRLLKREDKMNETMKDSTLNVLDTSLPAHEEECHLEE